MTTTNFDTTTTKIETEISSQNSRATQAISDAGGFLKNLQDAAQSTYFTTATQTPVNVDITVEPATALTPSEPREEIDAIKAAIPATPPDFESSVEADLSLLQQAPEENFNVPTIEFPDVPGPFDVLTKPSKQETVFPNVATKPTPIIPGDLTVSDQVIPNIPSISLPNFGEVIPTVSIDLPSATLAYVEPVYTSTLKTELASNLLSKIQDGGTGLNATVEGDIYNRDIERIAQKLTDDIDSTLNRFSGRGFTMPPGTVAAQVQELQVNHTNTRSQQSRDVATQMANIADANTKAFLQMGLSWEEVLISHANNIANRALEAEKSVVEFGISLFNTKIQKFNVELARYQAKDLEVQSNIKIQSLKLDQYRAELEGVAADTSKDGMSIENYKAKLAAHDAQVSLYEAETEAVNSDVNIQRAKIEIFKTDIDAYIAQIGAQKSEYDLYIARIQGETAKIDLYKSEVDAYVSRVEAVKISNETVQEKIKSDVAIEELKLNAHLANVDIWKAKVDLAVQELGIERDFYSGAIAAFGEKVKKAIANSELGLQADVRAGQFEQTQASLNLQQAVSDMNALIDQSRLRLSGAEALSNGYISMASMAIGAIQSMLQLSSEGVDNLNTTG